MEYIDAGELALSLGLKNKRMIIEQARKHFNLCDLMFCEVDVLTKNLGKRRSSNLLLTKEQACFLVSRSRGNTANAEKKFGLNCSSHSLFRGEQFFTSIINGMLDCTSNLKIERQICICGYLIDCAIIGSYGAILIEYDERHHKYSSEDDERRTIEIVEFMHSSGIEDIEIIRVEDTHSGIIDAITRISNLIHTDFVSPVSYKSHTEIDVK